uniref:Axin-1 n=1 Tax=Hofstenia miamia TaxID=442651 RepID=A0A068CMC6_HOFMI|nr:axin-1 [Hofstenia miamia]
MKMFFDPALRQVEYRLKHTLYPAFLASDTYLKCARNGGIFHSSDNGISCDNDYANEEDHVLLKEGIGVGVGVVQNDEPAAAKSSHRNDHLSRRFSNYAPTVSTDSELHSLSSDAITDDSYPKSDSLSEGASMQRKMRGLAKRSRRHVINPPKGLPNIPRYHQPLPKDMGLNPNEFASILIDRLNKLQREQRTHEAKKEEECLNKAECGRLKNILSSTPPDEDPESIVAAHVSRVFQDATECYSPPRTRCTTCGQRRTRPDTSSSISSGVDSGVFDAASLHSTESRTSDKRQMVLDWVKTSLEPHQHRQHIRHKTKHRLGSLSPGPQQRTTLVTFGRKPVNGRASSLERPLSGGLSVYKPGAEDKSPIKTHLFPADLVQDDSEKKSRSKKKVDVLTPTSYHMAPLATDEEKEETVVAYYFCTESIPYRTTVPCAHVTLAQFKKLITRRGRFRYFFKKASNEIEEGGVVFEEVTDDRCILPLFDGKVIGTIEKCD